MLLRKLNAVLFAIERNQENFTITGLCLRWMPMPFLDLIEKDNYLQFGLFILKNSTLVILIGWFLLTYYLKYVGYQLII